MVTEQLLPILNSQAFYDFAKLSKIRQIELLRGYGTFLDQDADEDTVTRLYFLHGFFVEEIVSEKNNEVMELIPYKQGYKLDNYLNERKRAS